MTPRNWFGILALVLFLAPAAAGGETQGKSEVRDLLAVIRDGQGGVLEGVLRLQPEAITVSSREEGEKVIPSRYIKSISLERVREESPGGDLRPEARYAVRLENSQEIYTLKGKFTFSLNTHVGVVTKTIDPEAIPNLFFGDSAHASTLDRDKPLIQDKSVVFTLEFKF